tara:strand:- start:443 stop:1126 length:684 start_codon:yes stop_codon:yes gene_type:complete
MKKLKTLGLIVARKNSKGLKNKHSLKLGDKKCIEWTFAAAKKSKLLDHCILSTDSKEIISISKKYKIHAPFIRPVKYSRDNSSVYDVIKHSVKWLKQKNYKFDLIVLLQGSSPFRKSHHIDNSIKLFKRNIKICKTLISVYELNKKNFWILKRKNNYVKFAFNQNNSLRRQNNNKVYLPNGGIFISRFRSIQNFYTNKTIFYLMDKKSSVDIDTLEDFKIAKNYIKN